MSRKKSGTSELSPEALGGSAGGRTPQVKWKGYTVVIRAGQDGTVSQNLAWGAVEDAIRRATTSPDWNPNAAYDDNLDKLVIDGARVRGRIKQRDRAQNFKLLRDAYERRYDLNTPWSGNTRNDVKHALEQILRYEKPKTMDEGKGYVNNADAIVEREFIQIPLSWYRHLQRPYRDTTRPYSEAIQILAYVVTKYKTGLFPDPLLWVRRKFIQELFGLSSDAEKAAVAYLVREGYLLRVIVKGYVPWRPRKRGIYRFFIPVIPQIRAVTWTSQTP